MSGSDEWMFEMDFEPPSSPESSSIHHQSTCHILEAILWPRTQLETEIHERAMKHVREMGEDRKRSKLDEEADDEAEEGRLRSIPLQVFLGRGRGASLTRRLMMRLRKDGYDPSLGRSSWVATTDHPGGDYEYIDVVVAGQRPGCPAVAEVPLHARQVAG